MNCAIKLLVAESMQAWIVEDTSGEDILELLVCFVQFCREEKRRRRE